jgi:hypothetical protein
MPDYEVTSPSGRTYRVSAPDGATQDQVLSYAQGQFAELERPKPAPAAMSIAPAEQSWGGAIKNVAQGLGHMGSSVTGGILGQAAGLGALGYDVIGTAATGREPGTFADPAAVQEKVTNALTYQPDDPNSMTMKAVQFPGKVIGGAGQYLNEKVTNLGGEGANPYLGHVAGAAPLAVASALGVKAGMPATVTAKTPALINGKAATQSVKVPVPGKAAPLKVAGASPQERAKNFVDSRTNLDWGSLSQAFRKRLEEVAATADNLERLDATAIERQGLLASLDKPIANPTRGQVTRDPLQQRNEQLVKATEAGKELRDLDLEHNKTLLDNLDVLQGRSGSKAAGSLQRNKSVQDALRGRFAVESANVRKLYDYAEEVGKAQGPVNIDKLVDYLKAHEDPTRVSYAADKLRALKAVTDETTGGMTVSQARPLTFVELEGIRKAASNAGKSADGTTRHYAKELSGVIEDVMAEAGGEAGKAYAAARSARKKLGDEFERTQAIARLVKNKKLSQDRATAVEDTWHKTVLTGSMDDLKNVRASLEKSQKGREAWNDIKAETIDYIKSKATGGERGLRNESGDLHTTWNGLRRAVDDIGPDKLREIFGEADAKKIETIVDAAQLLKTEAPTGVKGSPTIDKLLTLLDKVGKVPGLGKPTEVVGGAVKLAQKAKDIGKTGREIRKAKSTPLDDAK